MRDRRFPGLISTQHSTTSAQFRWLRLRVYLVVLIINAGLLVAGWRAWSLQRKDGDRLGRLAEGQHQQTITLRARRGRIMDRHGALLAISVDVPSVAANPRVVAPHTDTVVASLASVLKLRELTLRKRLRSNRYFVWLKRRVRSEVAQTITELRIPGVHLRNDTRRYYPKRALAGPVLGLAGIDGSGLDGLELSMDKWLTGKVGSSRVDLQACKLEYSIVSPK